MNLRRANKEDHLPSGNWNNGVWNLSYFAGQVETRSAKLLVPIAESETLSYPAQIQAKEVIHLSIFPYFSPLYWIVQKALQFV